MVNKLGNNIPPEIKSKLDKTTYEATCILEEAYNSLKDLGLSVNLRFEHSAPGDILNNEERYQQVCFITRFDCLPDIGGIEIEEKREKYYLANLDYLRHVLNEYRLILFNMRDSIHYKKLHSFCYKKLSNDDPSNGISIKAYDINKNDRTDEFIKFLNASTKAIDMIIKRSDLNYIYNGILQHNDASHTKRYWDDYYSGELNYIFLKNAILVSATKGLMDVYYKIIKTMTFPVLGSL